MHNAKTAAAIALLAALLAAGASAEDLTVTTGDLAKDPDAYVGKRVVIADCMVMAYVSIVGAQCSPVPLNASLLVYVDSDTLAPEAKKLGEECDTADLDHKCLVKVTGVVAKNTRGQALVKQGTMELVKRVAAF